MAKYTAARYAKELRAAVRGLWAGAFDRFDFYHLMTDAIRRGLTAAWKEGAAQAGVAADELTPAEQTALQQRQASEWDRVHDLSAWVSAHNRESKTKLRDVLRRVDLWALRYDDVRNQALTMAKTDPKLIWKLGPTREHCPTCSRLHGKVKRGSYWAAHGIRPQNPPNERLKCKGWQCKCSLTVTKLPLSKGPLPKTP